MIRKLRAVGFKSLANTEIDLGKFNVFIGANGSGKSNILEALGIVSAAAAGSIGPETLRYRGVRPGLPKLYKSSFKKAPVRRLITLEVTGDDELYRLGLDNPIDRPDKEWSITHEVLETGAKKIVSRGPAGCNRYDSNGLNKKRMFPDPKETAAKAALMEMDDHPAKAWMKTIEDFAIFSPTTPVLRGIAVDDVKRSPLGLWGSGLPRALREVFRDTSGFGPFDKDDVTELLDWAEDVQVRLSLDTPISPDVQTTRLSLRFTDRYMRPGRRWLSGYDASEGALYVLFMIALLAHREAPRLLAVDNFDQALHPRLAAALTRLISQYVVHEGDQQVLVTTHNPLVLDGLDLSNDEIRLFAVDRARDGSTKVSRVILDRGFMERNADLSLSRLWVMGRIGGVPKDII